MRSFRSTLPILTVVLALAAGSAVSAETDDPNPDLAVTPIAAIVEKPDAYLDQLVRVRGTIVDVAADGASLRLRDSGDGLATDDKNGEEEGKTFEIDSLGWPPGYLTPEAIGETIQVTDYVRSYEGKGADAVQLGSPLADKASAPYPYCSHGTMCPVY